MSFRNVLLSASALLCMPLYAGNVIFDINQLITGTAPASAANPWLRATFSDVAGGVQLNLQTMNLTNTEFVSKWGFSLNTLYNPSNLVIGFVGGAPAATTLTRSSNCCKLGGGAGGYYDIEFGFATSSSSGNRFLNGMTSQYLFSGISGLSTADFLTFGSATKTTSSQLTPWYTVAHVQSIGASGQLSGWVSGSSSGSGVGSAVPEPQSWMLFGTVAAGLTFAVRRRRKQTA